MNIILCGFMGSGKTTVGKILAKDLSYNFIDMDTYIEKEQGISVSQLFERIGESGFRDLEHAACVELAKRDRCVIATGGGAVTAPRNVAPLKQNGLLVYLHVSPEQVLKRLHSDTARPLLMEDRENKVRTLLSERHPVYAKAADIQVDASFPPKKVAKEIVSKIESRCPVVQKLV